MDDSSEHDDLIKQLNNIRIEREEATRNFQRTLEITNTIERNLLVRLRVRQTHQQLSNQETQNNLRNNRRNHLQVGDTVRITNTYKDSYGTVGIITKIRGRMVDIKNNNAQEKHTRAWWNLERLIPKDDHQN